MMGIKRQERRKGSVMHKSQLQEYAQKASIPPPVYDFIKEGASHEPRFKCIVILNGVRYESAPGFPNLKSAEHAAAKVALDCLQQTIDISTGFSPSPVHESGLCKNLLQEYAQKNNLPLPVYQSMRAGEDHAPTFSSCVEIAGVKYSGGCAKNKKEAEIKAAKTALLAIQSALSSVPVEPEMPVVPTPNPQVGLSTFIDSQLNSNKSGPTGRKRGRGDGTAGRRKKGENKQDTPGIKSAVDTPELSIAIKTEDPTASSISAKKIKNEEVQNAVKKDDAMRGAADDESTGKLPDESVTPPAVVRTGGIADLLATPTAQKILGVL